MSETRGHELRFVLVGDVKAYVVFEGNITQEGIQHLQALLGAQRRAFPRTQEEDKEDMTSSNEPIIYPSHDTHAMADHRLAEASTKKLPSCPGCKSKTSWVHITGSLNGRRTVLSCTCGREYLLNPDMMTLEELGHEEHP